MYSEILDKPIYLFMISMVIFPIISYFFLNIRIYKNICLV